MNIVWENAPFVFVMLFSGCLCLLLAVLALRRSSSPMALSFAGLMISVAIYAIGGGFEISGGNLTRVAFWLNFEYLGIAFIPALFFIMAAQNTGKSFWLRSPVVTLLFGQASLTFILKITNSLHHLIYRQLSLSTSGPFPAARITVGPYYWLNVGIAYLLLAVGTLFLLQYLFTAGQPQRLRAGVLLAGALAPWVANAVYLAKKSPWGLDLTPIGFAIAGPLFGWGILKLGAINLVPVARETVFWEMRDAVLVFDSADRLVDFNKSSRDLLGGLHRSDVGRPAADVLKMTPSLIDQLAGGASDEIKFGVQGEGGERIYSSRLSMVRDGRGVFIGKSLIFQDITDKEGLVQKLEVQARTDWLTGTMNRRHFMETAKLEVSRAKRYRRPLSIVILDIDHFKKLNDSHGHEFGDLALREVARVCRGCLRDTDLLARYGGDEFICLSAEATPEVAALIAERVRLAVASNRMVFSGKGIRLTVTIGVAGVAQAGTTDIDSLVQKADEALYRGKEAGRDRVVLS